MDKMVFQKNERAISRGNHVSTVDAEYCTKCSVDLAGPLFSGQCHRMRKDFDLSEQCPHMRIEYDVPDVPVILGPAIDLSGLDDTELAELRDRVVAVRSKRGTGPEWLIEGKHVEHLNTRPPEHLCPLTYQALRIANRARMPLFKNATGETKHSERDWTVSDWALATAGETGELAEVLLHYTLMSMALGKAENIMKKMRRQDFDVRSAKNEVADELADVAIYLDMLADKLGIDLGEAIMHKWNKKSRQLDIPLRLHETSVERTDTERL